MNGMQGRPEPEITKTDPQAYFLWLRGSGLDPMAAAQQVQQRFGPGKTPEERQRDAARQQESAGLAQAGGLVGGALITNEALGGFKNIRGAFGTDSAQSTPSGQNVQPVQPVAPQTPPVDASAANANVNIPPASEVGSVLMPDGTPGTLMSDGAKVGQNGKIINPDGSSGGSITGQALAGLQVAGGVAQAYNGYRQYQQGEKLGGAANIVGGAYGTAAGAQALAGGGTAGSLAPYAPVVGTGVAAAQIGQQMISDKGASEDRAAKSQAEALKASMLYIPGYGWAAYAAFAAADALTGGKATEGLVKFSGFNNKLTDKIDFGLGKSIRSKVFHQSTKGKQQERTGQLLQQSDDPTWQNYVAGMRLQEPKEGKQDKSKPFAGGKYASFDEYKKAGLQADDLTGVYGNLDAFKPDYAETKGLPNWAQLSFDQQKAVTQRLINENMYSSKKGDVVIADKEKARRIYEEMAATNFGVQPGQSTQPPATVARPQAGQVARVSPGMYMNDQGRVAPATNMRQSLQNNYSTNKGKKK